ncbi:glycoside hydrolase family 32 protein [Lysobacter korlensis]|uniref:beta-fructofuranosidase n=1 Tax=Lysobacter korlensis TaxID=553636 RepID=A0ABV6RNJ8_9GAMM
MRPAIHFTAETGWINDPHGVTFADGRYHLFHQYVPGSLVWAPNCHWGHATSADLLSWQRQGIAIAPGDGDDGIWTGSLVHDATGPRILYTSVTQPDIGIGRVRTATPADGAWNSWVKGDVVVESPADLDLLAFRDPFVVREADGWRMFIGAGTRSGDALALTYTSADLDRWEYDGVALERSTNEREPVWMGALWECPQVFEVDGRWVMVSSVWDDDVLFYAGYAVGDYADGRFTAESWGQLSFGGSYYAPSFFRDADGRPCLMFWMRGVADAEAGWSSALSVPHLLSVRDGRLAAEPHPKLAEKRGTPLNGNDLRGFGDAVVELEWDPVDDGSRLSFSADDAEVASIGSVGDALVLRRTGESDWSMPYTGGAVRVLLDGPVLEIATTDGLLGGPVAQPTAIESTGGELSAWRLDVAPAAAEELDAVTAS